MGPTRGRTPRKERGPGDFSAIGKIGRYVLARDVCRLQLLIEYTGVLVPSYQILESETSMASSQCLRFLHQPRPRSKPSVWRLTRHTQRMTVWTLTRVSFAEILFDTQYRAPSTHVSRLHRYNSRTYGPSKRRLERSYQSSSTRDFAQENPSQHIAAKIYATICGSYVLPIEECEQWHSYPDTVASSKPQTCEQAIRLLYGKASTEY